jgi:AcrR family transcriptional regulator
MVIKRAAARREQHREELRVEIRDAARAIFVRDGYGAFSMRKLAVEVGYSPAAIYLYFPSKQELFRSLVEESFERLHESLQALSREPSRDPLVRLGRGLRLYVDWGLAHPDDYQIAFLQPAPSNGPYRVHQAFAVLRSMVAECLPPAASHREVVERSSQAAWAAIHGITSLLIQRPSFPWQSKEEVIDQVIESAADGVSAARPRGRRRVRKP